MFTSELVYLFVYIIYLFVLVITLFYSIMPIGHLVVCSIVSIFYIYNIINVNDDEDYYWFDRQSRVEGLFTGVLAIITVAAFSSTVRDINPRIIYGNIFLYLILMSFTYFYITTNSKLMYHIHNAIVLLADTILLIAIIELSMDLIIKGSCDYK